MNKNTLGAAFVIAVAAVFQVVLAFQPIDFLITNILPDDAFYYYEIARNITAGQGSTFDGGNGTNGYHPLWMLVLLPLFTFFSDISGLDTAPIYASLAVSIAFNVGTAIILFHLVKRLTDRNGIRLFVLALYLFNPFVLFETINGLETSLSLFLLLGFILAAVRIQERNTLLNQTILAILAGLMILARMDLAFYFIAFIGWFIFTIGIRNAVRPVLYMGLLATLICVPWFIWNYLEFQMFFTSASNVNALVHHTLVAQDNGPGLFVKVKGALYLLVYHGREVLLRTGAPWLLFALAGALTAYLLQKPEIVSTLRKHRPVLLALFMGFVLLFFVNVGIRFTGRAWYFVSINIFIVLGAARILHLVLPKAKEKLTLCLLVLCIAGTFLYAWKYTLKNQFINQAAMFSMAMWVNAHLPEDTRIGVFNAGVQGYFTNATVINLDALVNNEAYAAMKERKLWTYAREEDIEYISDFEPYLTYRYMHFLDTPNILAELEPIHTIPVAVDMRNMGSITLYQVETDGVR